MLFMRYRYRSTILVVGGVAWGFCGDCARVLKRVFSVVFPIYLILLFT